jgi:hypothetical protein
MTLPSRGDRVVARWQPGTRHGEVVEVFPARLLIDPTEVAVRWHDGGWKAYDEHRFIDRGWGTWELKR